jgi:hypothetical protein
MINIISFPHIMCLTNNIFTMFAILLFPLNSDYVVHRLPYRLLFAKLFWKLSKCVELTSRHVGGYNAWMPIICHKLRFPKSIPESYPYLWIWFREPQFMANDNIPFKITRAPPPYPIFLVTPLIKSSGLGVYIEKKDDVSVLLCVRIIMVYFS